MKKIYIALAVLATASLVSCVKEEFPNEQEVTFGDNDIVMTLHNGSGQTRSGDGSILALKDYDAISIPVKVENSDQVLFLEQTIEDLNQVSPVTRGTPAYTENLGNLYSNQLGVHSELASFGDQVFVNVDEQMYGGGWRFHHSFDTNPWPNETTKVDFWLRMPANMTGVDQMIYDKDGDELHTVFTLESPETASQQQDLIFAATSINKEEHDDALPTGSKVKFLHALTGIKFIIVNNDEHQIGTDGKPKGKAGHTQTYITKVTISGLQKSGTGLVTTDVTPSHAEHEDFPENAYVRSFDGFGSVLWVYDDVTGTFSQSFEESDIVDYATGAGSFTSKGNYPESFSAAANTNNLNDGDATKTFWFIPQTLTDAVTMEVEFHVWDGAANGETKKLTVNLGAVATERGEAISKWEAGQIRTFMLKPNTVDVDIKDEINELIKSDVTIKNTGNVAEYVRVNIIANWVGNVWEGKDEETGDPVYSSVNTIMNGYAAETGVTPVDWSDLQGRVLAWNDKEPEEAHKFYHYGTFVGLPTKTTTGAINVEQMKAAAGYWVRLDKYYYYTKPIGPGEFVPETTPVFDSYTLDESKIPAFWVPDVWGGRKAAGNVHLEMDLAVQAIEAPLNENGQEASDFMTVWAAALNKADISGLDDL